MSTHIDTDMPVLRRTELGLSSPYRAPETDTEKSIAEIWQAVLNIDQIGVDDDFFEIGGDSLAATVLAGQLENRMSCRFSPSDIIDNSTISRQSIFIGSHKVNLSGSPDNYPPYLNLFNAEGTKPPLFIIHGGIGFTMYKGNFLEGIGSDQPVIFIEAPGLDGKGSRFKYVEEYAEFYLDAIRKVAPGGDWQIAANCLGGLIAIEICVQAEKKGDHVSRIMLIDPPDIRAKHFRRLKRKVRNFVFKNIGNIWNRFCKLLPAPLGKQLKFTIASSYESSLSADYGAEDEEYIASLEFRMKHQKEYENRVRRKLSGALPTRMSYSAEAMRQVHHDLHEAILMYKLPKCIGRAFILANRRNKRSLKFWKNYLVNLQCHLVKEYTHGQLFNEGLPDILKFLHNAMATDSEKHDQV